MVLSEGVRKAGRSLLGLIQMLAVTAWHGMVLLVRGDRRGSAEQMRFFAILVHDDMLASVVWLQKRWSGDPVGLRGPDRILVVKLDRIGDMINTIPVLDELARRFPRAAIDMVAHPVPLSFFDGDARIRERIVYRSALYHAVPFLPPSWNEWKTVVSLARRRYPLVVYLRGSAPFLLLGARSRFAATKYVMNEHVVERYLKAIRPFVRDARQRPATLHLSADAKRSAAELLGSTGVLRIAMHATAAVALKEWPLDRYVALADELRRRYRADIHFLASPAERHRLEAALAGSTSKHQVHTSLSLGKVAALIAACDLFVGNDSGLSHVAAAVNTPMVLVWGPANIHEAKPLADPVRCAIEYRAVPCRSRCQEIRCVNDETPMQCLRDVQVQDVLAAAGKMLEAVSEQSWRRIVPAS